MPGKKFNIPRGSEMCEEDDRPGASIRIRVGGEQSRAQHSIAQQSTAEHSRAEKERTENEQGVVNTGKSSV